MSTFLIGLAVGAITGGTIVGALASAVFRMQTDTDHWCPDEADLALRVRQYTQEAELAALGGDR